MVRPTGGFPMLINRDRQKMIHAIIYFAQNTRHCGKTKLHKLLYLLDFEHFQKTGRSVTGLDYFAWKMGPVPVALQNELDDPQEDFQAAIGLACEQVIDLPRLNLNPNANSILHYSASGNKIRCASSPSNTRIRLPMKWLK
jgi:hypothetical protein